ncbi:MAG: sigma-70 family RNA polymerase sigma factor [Actinomycetota bacterium]
MGRAARQRLGRTAAASNGGAHTRASIDQTLRRVGASVRHVGGQDTQDIVQESLARAVRSGVALDAEPWLKTVARRVAIDRARRRREYPSGLPVELERWVSDHDGNPEEMLIRAERSAEVRRALDQLPPRYRKALLLFAEENSPAAVAKRMGLSAKATWTLLSRARSRLRVEIERIGFVPALFAGRAKWKSLFGAAAAASVAVTIALLPPGVDKTNPPKTPIVQVPQAAAPTSPVAAAPTKAVSATPVQDLVEVVEGVVNEFVPREVAKLGVKSCVDTPKEIARIGVLGVSLIQNEPDPGPVDELLNVMPESIRTLELDLC